MKGERKEPSKMEEEEGRHRKSGRIKGLTVSKRF
jgi:hypothetical protein